MSTAPPLKTDNPVDLKALDLLVNTFLAMNRIDPDNEHGGDVRYATSSEGYPYWHVEQAAQQAAAHLVGGNQRRAEQLVYTMHDSDLSASEALAVLRQEWAAADPIGEALRRMIFQAEEAFEVRIVRWLGVRCGYLWVCKQPGCDGQTTSEAHDVCDVCGTARPRT